jgi:hypothetical protein
MKNEGTLTPQQPSPNNGGEEVAIDKRTDNPTHPHPGKGHQKSEQAWQGYGKTPKGSR